MPRTKKQAKHDELIRRTLLFVQQFAASNKKFFFDQRLFKRVSLLSARKKKNILIAEQNEIRI